MEYNGWTNYETWVVKLWQDNDESSYNFWRDNACEFWAAAETSSAFTRAERAALDLADFMKDRYEEENPIVGSASVWADLVGAALSEVNWYEIAQAWINDGDFRIEESEEYDELLEALEDPEFVKLYVSDVERAVQ